MVAFTAQRMGYVGTCLIGVCSVGQVVGRSDGEFLLQFWISYKCLSYILGVPGNIDPASETCGFEISPKALEAQ